MFWRKRKLVDFSSEIESHLALEIERLQQERGLSYDEARFAAQATSQFQILLPVRNHCPFCFRRLRNRRCDTSVFRRAAPPDSTGKSSMHAQALR